MSDERFIPGSSRITEIESFHRYYAAAELCRGCKVLDVASGEGYGSAILARSAREVAGLDIDVHAVELARMRYAGPNLSFICGDAGAMPFADGEFDCVVSFETIEHLDEPEKLLAEIRRVLKVSGFVILSSPNKTAFDRRNNNEHGENAYHKHELECDELVAAMKRFFPEVAVYAQDSFFSSQIGGDSSMRYFVKGKGGGVIRQEALQRTQYSVVIAGAGKLPALSPSSYIDADFDEKYGYQPDDEAIVHQFGLRGEFERAWADLNSTRSELANTREELEKSRAELGETGKELANVRSELERSGSDLAGARDELEKSRAELGETRSELGETRGELANVRSELANARGELANTRSELENAHDELAKTGAELANIRNKLNDTQRELNDTQGELENTRNELDNTRGKLENAQGELAKTRGELDNTRGKLENTQSELDNTRGKLENAQGELAKTRGELDNTRGKLENTQSELENTRGELAKTRNELESSHDELAKTGAELANIRNELESSHDELAKTGAELVKTRNELDNTRGKLDDTQSELENTRGELAKTSNELESSHDELAKTGAELKGTREELYETRNEAARLRERLDASEKNAARIGDELESVRRTDAARMAELERQRNEERAKAEYLWGEYESLKRAWSLRIFGRFALRRRLGQLIQSLGRFTCRCGKGVIDLLGVRHSTRIKLKNMIYRRFGFCLKSWPSYNDWLLIHRNAEGGILKPGAGLVVPDDLPMTSIVIPVYNNLEYTLNCLDSIYRIKSRAPFEVIVVDDCSTDDYASALRREYPQVRLVRNDKNSGFLLTVNHGAREAKGEYVLFLNNDTTALPGWLDELATALYHHPEAGMIGSQLIHMRTGTLQESGDLICKNGEMLPLGRGCEPDHPEFSYFREVDFVSAASIILRKSVFDEMNGFDTAYAPAYFEDPDLGLRLQKAGYKNYVMPLSRVMHMEMASYGNALNERCERNRNFFMERWKDYLAGHALYATAQDFFECRKFPRERILYIDAEVPMADRGSGGMDAIFFMNYFLKRGCDVVFHGEYTPGCVPKYTEILLRMGVECVYAPQRKIWEYLECCGWTFSWLFISRIYQAQCFDRLLKKHCPQARYIFDTVDLHFVREQLEAELHDDPALHKQAARTKKFELAVASSADATIVISRNEKNLLEKEYGLTNVWHIPQARSIAGRKEGVERKGAVFIGSAHPPNMDGLRYFHDEILPLLPRNFRLTIIGEALRDVMKKMPEYQDLLKCPQFKFVGFVRELGDVLDTALMTVAPLRYGAGTKGKVASSMSYGVPCVSSGFGIEGTGMAHGKNILLAQTPEEFAEAIRALSEDPALWKKISDGGLDFLRSEYDPGKVEAEMDELFSRVRGAAPSGWAKTAVIPKQEELADTD